jgi:hypothetical protein
MNALSVDIKDMLEADSSLGLAFGTNLAIGKEKPNPVECVTIFDTPGFPPDLTLDKVHDYYNSSCQILIRGSDYPTGIVLARNIMVSLHSRVGSTWNGTLYTVIRATGEPSLLDWVENNRPRFIINFNCQRR